MSVIIMLNEHIIPNEDGLLNWLLFLKRTNPQPLLFVI